MNFVRGESSDTAVKGDRYRWSAKPLPAVSGRKRSRLEEPDDDESYFHDDEDSSKPTTGAADLDDPLDAYMASLEQRDRASAASARAAAAPAPAAPDADDEVDPLDAFMAGLDSAKPVKPALASGSRPTKQCDEDVDPAASYMEDADKQAAANAAADGATDGADGGLGGPRRTLRGQKGAQIGGELGEVDHDAVEYEPFERCLYTPHPTVATLTDDDIRRRRAALKLTVSGFDVPAPVDRFDQVGLSRELMGSIHKRGYDAPTSIQRQALPVALSGRDLIGVASTGSGKTLACALSCACAHGVQRARSGSGLDLADRRTRGRTCSGTCSQWPLRSSLSVRLATARGQ